MQEQRDYLLDTSPLAEPSPAEKRRRIDDLGTVNLSVDEPNPSGNRAHRRNVRFGRLK